MKIEFEVNEDIDGELHERLCKAIHEMSYDAILWLYNHVIDIREIKDETNNSRRF